MKVLFVYPNWTREYGIIAHFAKRAGVYPPLNLALLAAIAERHGHEAVIIDAEVDCIPMPKLIEKAIAQKADLIAITGKSPFFHLSRDFGSGIKKAGCATPIVIGGPHITIMEAEAFFPEFDYGVVGECENIWPVLLERLEKGLSVADVKGVLYRDRGEIKYTGKNVYDRDLDKLPFPARHLLPMARYRIGTLQGRKNFTSIQTVRGCPWKCIFCASEALNTTSVGRRSAELVIAEMKEVIARFNIRHFMIVDDVLTLDRKHITDICDRIIAEKLNITFEGSTRANLIDEPLIIKMKAAGLARLSFGLETVDEEMRKTMKKKVPLEYYSRANALLGKYDIEALNSVMLGLPGETKATVKKTLDFLKNDRNVKQANFAIAVPYPGTEFHEMAKKGERGLKLMTKDFSEYRRYGSAVTTVGDLTPEDLIELQNEGFVSIYSPPWRWRPMLRKHGLVGGALMLLRVFKLSTVKALGKYRFFREHPAFQVFFKKKHFKPNLNDPQVFPSTNERVMVTN